MWRIYKVATATKSFHTPRQSWAQPAVNNECADGFQEKSNLASWGRGRFSSGMPSVKASISSDRFSLAIAIRVPELSAGWARLTMELAKFVITSLSSWSRLRILANAVLTWTRIRSTSNRRGLRTENSHDPVGLRERNLDNYNKRNQEPQNFASRNCSLVGSILMICRCKSTIHRGSKMEYWVR